MEGVEGVSSMVWNSKLWEHGPHCTKHTAHSTVFGLKVLKLDLSRSLASKSYVRLLIRIFFLMID